MPSFLPLRSFGQSISALSSAPKKAFAKLEKLANFDMSKADVLMQQVAKELIPDIKRELGISFDKSGIQSRTGTLRRACVDNAIIEVDKRGILISMAANVKYANPKSNIYASAGVKRYGGVTGASEMNKRAKSKWKKTLALVGEQGGAKYIPPSPPFQQLTSDQREKLRLRQLELIKIKIKQLNLGIV